ncbi:MAG: two-component system sensor histidine kinase CreC [bacterium]|nr:two-component system sensor histidine kinase CreC [bacterium]
MKIGIRIFLAYLAIFLLCLIVPFNLLIDDLDTRYREGVEDPLVDFANILAAQAEDDLAAGRFPEERWRAMFARIYDRALSARIYDLHKTHVDIRVYSTDQKGMVLFDSKDPANIGRDFSRWLDVAYTLQGKYGARTTRRDSVDSNSSELYVAAPIYMNGAIVGVLSVSKPTTNILYFIAKARYRILAMAGLSLLAAAVLSFLVAYWITRPIKRLTRYALGIRDNRPVPFPRLDNSELGEMGRAFADMQEALEGKQYVECYVEHLTHELKSPLSAIAGAAELLDGPMEEEQRHRFLVNIQDQSKRMQEIVERMLELAALENTKHLHKQETIALAALVRTVLEEKEPLICKKKLGIENSIDEQCRIVGDPFLLHQALANILQNAIEFSPNQGLVGINAKQDGEIASIRIKDQGPGIPAFARERIFEKFFSLQRPDTGKKSTGLGLNFVQQVAILHGGSIELHKSAGGGVEAVFTVGSGFL